MSKLYLECSAGISGDMVVASLLDLGASEEKLRSALASLPVDGFEIEISRVQKCGLDCCDFNVVLEEENHDHSMQYLHGHEHGHEYDHTHAHAPDHAHDHVHRNLADIQQIIGQAAISDNAKNLANKIFGIVAQAEAQAHGLAIDQVHFHEVGAVDSIADIVAVAVCLDDLNIEECIIPVLNEGTGTVRAQHGILPIPVPAVANIVQQYGLPVHIMQGVEGEFITPTGAAIAAAICTQANLPQNFTIEKTGTGAGKRNYSRPSMLRAMLIEEASTATTDSTLASQSAPHLWKLETEVDDTTGEALGFVLDALYEAGAREAHYIPVFMKKGRPGYKIEVLCEESNIAALEEALFMHTTTIGVRRSPLWRTALERSLSSIETAWGSVDIKTVILPTGATRSYPEHASIARIASETGLSYQEVLRKVLAMLG